VPTEGTRAGQWLDLRTCLFEDFLDGLADLLLDQLIERRAAPTTGGR
jgi:hypothetical protein